MWLVKCGVPFDVAFGAPEDWLFAMTVKMAEFEGTKFNWETLQFYREDKQ